MNSKEIIKLRCRAQMTVKEFAEKIGVGKTTVYAWERNLQKPSPIHLLKLEKLKKELQIKNKTVGYEDYAKLLEVKESLSQQLDSVITKLGNIISFIEQDLRHFILPKSTNQFKEQLLRDLENLIKSLITNSINSIKLLDKGEYL